MDVLALLWIPATMGGLLGVLLLTASIEQHVLSPRAYVIRVVRSRRADPDYAEALVTAQLASIVGRRD
jgi:hypothetical protein